MLDIPGVLVVNSRCWVQAYVLKNEITSLGGGLAACFGRTKVMFI